MNNQNNNMNRYNTDINSTRAVDNIQNTQLEQNPYINQQTNIDQNQNPINTTNTQSQSVFTNGDFVKGALIGAAVTFLLTNKNAQETIFKAASKGSELFQAGMEELKERYEDAKAQMESK
ncbi:hypothetical protein CP965_13125 [Halarcobacter mediterraneus]|uniref:YtxH domain-containing protein n=1 Tax=Halarcobacter mediterraneus TaxID=2023153 RepID=A0A4V1M106_9BACT|nr:YtxH domain-containing protein [Halarcobacter mediterraneus]RXK11704.1 hypothetical protein CP965_13125 [Halarcobacter mediterraneus]